MNIRPDADLRRDKPKPDLLTGFLGGLALVTTAVAIIVFFATWANAQQWARPAKTPNTDVKCTGCPGRAKDQMTPGFPAALGTYLGRYLDSSNSSDCQRPTRTWRAYTVLPMPSLGRIYFQIGSTVMRYDMGRFFQRVAAGETLTGNDRSRCFTPIADTVLQWDSSYYMEQEPIDTETHISSSGWDVSNGGDGQQRLHWFDVDERGYVYLASTWYGFGIVKDDAGSSNMTFVSQIANPEITAALIAAVKDSTGKRYALVSDKNGSTLIYDMTAPSLPKRIAKLPKPIWNYAKNADSTRIAIATPDGRLEIYTVDNFVAGGAPLFTRSDDSMIQAVASDGTNFYSAAVKSSALVLSSYVPDGATYRKVVDYSPAPRATISVENLRYGAGYLTAAGFVDGSYELRLFKVSQ